MQTEHIHGGNVEQIKREYGLSEEQITDFSANINFMGPPASIYSEISAQLEKIKHYPARNSWNIKPYLAQYLEIDPGNIIIGNGAAELIYGLIDIFTPHQVLIPQPSFSEYGLAVNSRGGEVQALVLEEEKDFKLSVDKLLSGLETVDLVFLCNPHNPTGQLISRSRLISIVEKARRTGVMVVVDEAFIDFIPAAEDYSLRWQLANYDNLFVLGSLTKFFAIPGLRLGYGLGNREIIAKMESGRDPWSVNVFAQLVVKRLLQEKEYIRETRHRTGKERNYLQQALAEFKQLRVYDSAANFLFCQLKTEELTSTALRKKLLPRGIMIRDCSSFQGLDDRFFRIAVKERAANQKLISGLAQILS